MPAVGRREARYGRTRAAATSRTVDAPLAKGYSPRMPQRAVFLVGTFWVGAALIGNGEERLGAITGE